MSKAKPLEPTAHAVRIPAAAVVLDGDLTVPATVGLHAALGIDIPETDYSRVATLDGCIAYLESRRIP